MKRSLLAVMVLSLLFAGATYGSISRRDAARWLRPVDHSRVLFSVAIGPEDLAKNDRIATKCLQRIRRTYVEVYGRKFAKLSFVRSLESGDALLREAREQRCGSALQTVLSDFRCEDGKVDYTVTQTMAVWKGGKWQTLFSGPPPKIPEVSVSPEGIVQCDPLVSNPAEIPFFEAKLPIEVVEVENLGDAYEVTVSAQSWISVKVTHLFMILNISDEGSVNANQMLGVTILPYKEKKFTFVLRLEDYWGKERELLSKLRDVPVEQLSACAYNVVVVGKWPGMSATPRTPGRTIRKGKSTGRPLL
ncbi:MAG: hypothetical protein ACYTFZ_06820 [Planctomycetota bacterium]